MDFGTIVLLIVIIPFALLIFAKLYEKNKIDGMSLVDRNNYIYGSINTNLVCPHCQTKGLVHVKKVAKVATSTGTVGGIFRANTHSTTSTIVTQHHCEQCNSTWNI